jgi:hypothetical protein
VFPEVQLFGEPGERFDERVVGPVAAGDRGERGGGTDTRVVGRDERQLVGLRLGEPGRESFGVLTVALP